MIATGSGEAKAARDGRRWTLRPGRPTDGRPLARLFSEVRTEGRWLIATPGSVSEPSEAFWISELIRANEHLAVLSICIARDWRDVGIGSELVEAAQRWAIERGLRKMSLGVFPDNERAIAVYEKRGFVREGVRRMQYRSGDTYRDEVLMAWFPDGEVAP